MRKAKNTTVKLLAAAVAATLFVLCMGFASAKSGLDASGPETFGADINDFDYIGEVAEVSSANASVQYKGIQKIEGFEVGFKWVGGVYLNGKIYGVPSGADNVSEIDTRAGTYAVFGQTSDGDFKWSGGCVWKDGNIYCFPRRANSLLRIDTETRTTDEIDLGTDYMDAEDHHYSGTLFGDTICLSPRAADHILAIDLPSCATREIGKGRIPAGYTYCGAVRHPNGRICFLPQANAKVMVLDPDTETVSFIGEELTAYAFGAVVADNGNIYGFSSKVDGVLKIDPASETAEIISVPNSAGCYGSVLGVNGKFTAFPAIR
jgi:hypothetical protein